MDISFLGQSAFLLKGKGAALVTDPFDSSGGSKFPKVEADIVTVSHDHAGHNAASSVGGSPFVVGGPGEYEIKGVKIAGVPSFHDEKEGKLRGKNTIYNMKIDGVWLCHLGDLGQKELSNGQLEKIGNVDILAIPVGGEDTIDAEAAAQIVAKLSPKIVVPMHYLESLGDGKVSREGVEKFLKEMGVEKMGPADKLSISREKLPEELQVVLLQRRI